MGEIKAVTYTDNGIVLRYYEMKNNKKPLLMLHAQGVCSLSYDTVFKALSRKYHIFAVDCYGHGYSSHEKEKYNIQAIGDDMIRFIEKVVKEKVSIIGHSSGGLIAAYIASHSDLCETLYLEDPPFFSSQGDRRFKTFNYLDLSSICHRYNEQKEEKDFVLYYFANQKAWDFFPEKSRDNIRNKMIKMAAKYRKKHPDKDLKVPFWPKSALSGYRGMNQYDPYFGEAFYDDSFHAGLSHVEILKNIRCETIIMKAETNINEEGILMAAMSEEDVEKVNALIADSKIVRFSCGHGIHIEKKKDFIKCLLE